MQTTTRPRGRGLKWLVGAALLPFLILAVYLAFVLNWSYSDGERAGYLQKFSRKGWLCKTYEGELWQSVVTNVSPTIWLFSVRDEAVARSLDTLVGRPVRVHYTEHRGVPTDCFAETPYFVDAVTVVPE